jgi:hypothetical protein
MDRTRKPLKRHRTASGGYRLGPVVPSQQGGVQQTSVDFTREGSITALSMVGSGERHRRTLHILRAKKGTMILSSIR